MGELLIILHYCPTLDVLCPDGGRPTHLPCGESGRSGQWSRLSGGGRLQWAVFGGPLLGKAATNLEVGGPGDWRCFCYFVYVLLNLDEMLAGSLAF